MENVGAVKELCKVTGKLENRIDQLERITMSRNASIKTNTETLTPGKSLVLVEILN